MKSIEIKLGGQIYPGDTEKYFEYEIATRETENFDGQDFDVLQKIVKFMEKYKKEANEV